MLFELRIMRDAKTRVHVSVDAAFDATGVEVGNGLRWALLEAIPQDEPCKEHDQFLIATATLDWAASAFRGRRPCIATVPLSQGRPCATVPYPPEHARLLEGECHVVLKASESPCAPRESERTIHAALAA